MAKKDVKKVAKEDPELTKWIETAKELNTLFGKSMEPPLPTEDVTVDQLKEQINDPQVLENIPEKASLSEDALECLAEIGWEPKSAPLPKGGKGASKAPVNAKAKPAPAKKAGPKKAEGGGVIASIVEMIQAAPKTGISIDDMADQLKKKFPDRELESMKSTIRVQCGGRLKREKNIDVYSVKKGVYAVKK